MKHHHHSSEVEQGLDAMGNAIITIGEVLAECPCANGVTSVDTVALKKLRDALVAQMNAHKKMRDALAPSQPPCVLRAPRRTEH